MTNPCATHPQRRNPLDHLFQLGWKKNTVLFLEDMATEPHCVARVISVQRNLFLVSNAQEEWLCSAAGKLLHAKNADFPVTGDWVLTHDKHITAVLPRQNMLSRGEAGSHDRHSGIAQKTQPIAANLDTVFIVSGLDRDFNLRRLERYLTLVYNCGINPVIILTKADLQNAPENFQMEVESIAFGVPVILCSAKNMQGKEEVEQYIQRGQTVAMIGSSGAGKSTLANMLYGKDIQITAHVSESVGKGRHTTTHRELLKMPQGGMLIDNPGIREIAFSEGGEGIQRSFEDIEQLAEYCRFADCTHQTEPGCAVLRAVQNGELPAERLESYHKMQRELDYLESRSTKSADRIEKERWKDVALRIKDLKRRRR